MQETCGDLSPEEALSTSGTFGYLVADVGSPYGNEPVALVVYGGDFSGPRKPIGLVLAAPQVPQWMSSQYPDVVAAQSAGGPVVGEYTREWFEQIVYIKQIATVEEEDWEKTKAAHEALVAANKIMQTPYSRGCSKSSPLVRLTEYKPDGTATLEPTRYHGLIMSYWDAAETKVKEIGLLRVPEAGPYMKTMADSLRAFVNSNRHAYLRRKDPPDESRHRVLMSQGAR